MVRKYGGQFLRRALQPFSDYFRIDKSSPPVVIPAIILLFLKILVNVDAAAPCVSLPTFLCKYFPDFKDTVVLATILVFVVFVC